MTVWNHLLLIDLHKKKLKIPLKRQVLYLIPPKFIKHLGDIKVIKNFFQDLISRMQDIPALLWQKKMHHEKNISNRPEKLFNIFGTALL